MATFFKAIGMMFWIIPGFFGLVFLSLADGDQTVQMAGVTLLSYAFIGLVIERSITKIFGT